MNPNQTYAQALLNNSGNKPFTVQDDMNTLSVSPIRKHNTKIFVKPSCQTSVNQDKYRFVLRAGKTVHHETKNVPVSLYNRFQVFCNLQNDDTCEQDINTSSSVSNNFSDHIVKSRDTEMRSFQHSEECKHPTSPLGDDLQSQLAVQANCFLKGNKNGIGSFIENSTRTKTFHDDCSISTSSYVKDQNSLSGYMKPDAYGLWSENNYASTMIDANADNKEGKPLLVESDISLQPQLAVPKVLFSGNKNICQC